MHCVFLSITRIDTIQSEIAESHLNILHGEAVFTGAAPKSHSTAATDFLMLIRLILLHKRMAKL